MNQTEQDKRNQQNCKKCDRIVGCDYRGQKHKCRICQGDNQVKTNCDNCKKLGKTTCGNEIDGRCFEPIESDDNYDIQSI